MSAVMPAVLPPQTREAVGPDDPRWFEGRDLARYGITPSTPGHPASGRCGRCEGPVGETPVLRRPWLYCSAEHAAPPQVNTCCGRLLDEGCSCPEFAAEAFGVGGLQAVFRAGGCEVVS